jgi:starch phosphorylase
MRTLKYAQSFEVISDLPEHLESLHKLAMNFRWTWNLEAGQVFQEVDPQLWEQVEHNPLMLLRRLTPERQSRLASDNLFLGKLKLALEDLDRYMAAETWFDKKFAGERERTKIAYFCAEFGLNECLPIYSGGLGLLAGDHLKAASDLGIPLVGVGLLYSRGYFRQQLTEDGWQQENYETYDFYGYPITLLRGADDQPLKVTVEFPDRVVSVQIWKAQVGRVELYLLDSNILSNQSVDQGITDTLYGGDEHMRIRQEMVLGIGGLKALKLLGIHPSVCHMNEGHAAFLTIERLRQFMDQNNCDLRTARKVSVAGNVFTTHTPVPAGFDVFRPELLKQYMARNIESVGLDFEDFLTYGRMNPEVREEPFNMAILAMENANYVNGVSKLHAEVSREMFADRWDEFPVQEVPIDAVTNGVHTSSWLGQRTAELLDRHLGPTWRDDPSSRELWQQVSEIPAEDLWELRESSRADFVRFARKRTMRNLQRKNASKDQIAAAGSILDPRILTIGFARRFATYKRAFLLFSDKERLKAMLYHTDRPIQFVFAGKSHPKDDGGKKLIQDITNFIRHEGGSPRMVFLEDYDIEIARNMIQGVDVWLNNPRRPMEASGTSGMKVVPNGGLNCSILDGWWAEGYAPGTGWAIGDDREDNDHFRQDWNDSRALYQILEQEIAPKFYSRDENGIPQAWVGMMRNSMRDLAPAFSTARMLREYTTRFYMPASTKYWELQENNLVRAKDALGWRKRIRDNWNSVKIVGVEDSSHALKKVGEQFTIKAIVNLGDLNPDEVRVQVIWGTVGSNRSLTEYNVEDMIHSGKSGDKHTYELYLSCQIPGHRGYICRVVPDHEDVRVATELPLITWQTTE